MYEILDLRRHKTAESFEGPEGKRLSWYAIEMIQTGKIVKDMEDAKAKYGGYPILQPIPQLTGKPA